MTDETNQESTPAPTEETTSHAPTPTTPWHKGMASPNPRGRPKQPKTVAEVRALAQEKTAAMIEVLGRVALNPKAPFAARVAAASRYWTAAGANRINQWTSTTAPKMGSPLYWRKSMADSRYEILKEQLSDPRWRLNNLYFITDKSGNRIQFQMNWAQESLMNDLHFCNVILKARQLGFTTFIQIFMLDQCIFNSNIRAGTIAHRLDDARLIFRDKVKYPYDNLPEALRNARPLLSDSAEELVLANNSSIRVGTSLRSGTLQYLHISEYGKLCAQFADKAREVRTGALNTLQAGQIVFIESTAEGKEGHFFEMCETAQAKQRMGTRLTELDFKFHFYPWWREPSYELDPEGVVIGDDLRKYFDKLESCDGIQLSDRKRAWYSKKM